MKTGEIQALKDIVDKVLPEVELAECERLPIQYQAIVKLVISAIQPAIQSALDSAVAALPVDAATV